uniref:Uncharacterized protein n=1 Tax=Photinus pyralis TaxID=7054 RepID=A0A1Y1MV84_PHOPY
MRFAAEELRLVIVIMPNRPSNLGGYVQSLKMRRNVLMSWSLETRELKSRTFNIRSFVKVQFYHNAINNYTITILITYGNRNRLRCVMYVKFKILRSKLFDNKKIREVK